MSTPVSAERLQVYAEAGILLAVAVRDAHERSGSWAHVSSALAAYDAAVAPPAAPRLSVTMPASFLARDVTLQIGKRGSRWVVEALDQHGNLYDVAFDGYTGVVRCVTKGAAEKMLTDHGAALGQKLWAVPQQAVRS